MKALIIWCALLCVAVADPQMYAHEEDTGAIKVL